MTDDFPNDFSEAHDVQPLRFARQASALKGRGTAWDLPHRFHTDQRDITDDGWGTLDQAYEERTLSVDTEVFEESAVQALSRNDSPDVPFTYALNPYRGCEHGCIYCYARATHSYLNWSPGLDFETRLVAKMNIAERLRIALQKRSYQASAINIGSATDAYQPIERQLQLTRQVLEVMERCRHPYTIITKSAGILRDLDLLASAAQRQQVLVCISVTTLNSELARKLEPRAAAPHRRLEAIRRLSEAGIPVAVNVSPIIPFLNEPEIENIIAEAARAGAQRVNYTVVRLPWEVAPLFQDWLQTHVPGKAARIMARIKDLRGLPQNGDKVYNSDFAMRMKGEGIWADMIAQRVKREVVKQGLTEKLKPLDISLFDPRRLDDPSAQQSLFE